LVLPLVASKAVSLKEDGTDDESLPYTSVTF